MKKYQELENKIKELQVEVERLKKEEKDNELPDNFRVDRALEFLKTYSKDDLNSAFNGNDTPQGHGYWANIWNSLFDDPEYVVPDKAIIQIQKWIIIYYQKNENATLDGLNKMLSMLT
jgi:hypothetical protein